MKGTDFFGFTVSNGGGGGGGIGGGGTLNYLPVFTPDGSNVGNSILRQDTVVDNTVNEVLKSSKVSTNNNAVTTLQTIPIPADSVVLIESKILARKTGGAGVGSVGEGNGYIRTVKVKNVGGVVTMGTVQLSYTSEDIAPFNTTFNVSGTNILLVVSGSNNNNVDWNGFTKINILT